MLNNQMLRLSPQPLADKPSTQGAWCVVSSPLILGYDVLDTSITEKVWSIISNHKAVEVNQQYAGHPGRLVKAWDVVPPPPPPGGGFLIAGSCDNSTHAALGWSFDAASGHLTHDGKCVESTTDPSELQVTACDAASPNRELPLHITCSHTVAFRTVSSSCYIGFNFLTSIARAEKFMAGPGGTFVQASNHKNSGGCIDIYCARQPCGPNVQVMHCHAGSNQEFTIESGGLIKAKSGQCLAVSATDPAHSGGGDPGSAVKVSDFSLWAKPQPEGVTAVFLMSNQNATTQKPSSVRTLPLLSSPKHPSQSQYQPTACQCLLIGLA